MKKTLTVVMTAVLLNIVLVSCQISDSYKKSEEDNYNYSIYNSYDIIDTGPVKGGVLNIYSTSYDTLDPIMTKNLYVQRFSNLIYEGLFKVNESQQAVPVLADSWEVSEDKLIYSFHIREGVRWHDGTPLTAEDVEFTFAKIQDESAESIYKSNLKNIVTFAAINRDTFRVVLKKPNSFTPELMTFPIMPRHLADNEGLVRQPEGLVPVGTGPYKVETIETEEYIKLSQNKEWWKSGENPDNSLVTPYIDNIKINLYSGSVTEIEAFQTGDTHIACVKSEDFSKYKSRPDIVLKKYPGRDFDFIAFNTSIPALSDKSVRQAIAYTIDKEQIIADIMPGMVIKSDFPLIPGSWLHEAYETSYRKDMDKARRLLEDNGWKIANNVLFKKIDGKNVYLNIELLVNEDNQYRVLIAERIKEGLKEIGINVEVKKTSWDEASQRIHEKDFDMVITGYRTTSMPDITYMYASKYSSPNMGFQFADGMNLANYSNDKVDSYFEYIFSEQDYNKRKDLYYKLFKIIDEDVPYIGLYFYNNAIVYNKSVRGNLSPFTWDVLNNIVEWYIPER